MVPKESAKELVGKYCELFGKHDKLITNSSNVLIGLKHAKEAALIAVDLILEGNNLLRLPLKYWQDVKKEIEAL